MKRGPILYVFLFGATLPALADYDDVANFFSELMDSGNAAIFPVGGNSLDDIESAFGPRIQSSTDQYDWHRGIDIDGTLNTDPVVAALDGYFYDYRYTASGGNIVILEHRLSDFGTASLTYQGETVTKFYTWYLHLYDDGVADNATSTDDLVSSYAVNQAISRGTQIGVLGDSGGSGGEAYAPHLHFELRLATNSSLEYQLANNPGTTQWGFDPHLNPLLLFSSGGTSASLALTAGSLGDGDLTFTYTLSDDDTPTYNAASFSVVNRETEEVVLSHLLDLNQRIGYNAESTAELDTLDTTVPYQQPLSVAFTASEWLTTLVVPASWLAGYTDGTYELRVSASDIWGNAQTLTVLSAIPEPAAIAAWLGALVLGSAGWRRRPRA